MLINYAFLAMSSPAPTKLLKTPSHFEWKKLVSCDVLLIMIITWCPKKIKRHGNTKTLCST